MSLINQMLKDLEKRTHLTHSEIAIPVTLFSPSKKPSSKRSRMVIVVLFIGLLFFIIAFSYKIVLAHHPAVAHSVKQHVNVRVQQLNKTPNPVIHSAVRPVIKPTQLPHPASVPVSIAPLLQAPTLQNTVAQEASTPVIKPRKDLSMGEKYQHALQLIEQGHNTEAIAKLTALLEINPDYVQARESLASLFIVQGKNIKAEQIIKIGLQQRPFYPDYMQLKATLLVNEGKIKEALNVLQIAPPTLGEDPDYHAFIAALYQRQGQPLFAEKLYEQLLALQPNNATWWMGLGIALESLGRRTLAIEAYLKAEDNNLNPELKAYAGMRVHDLQ